MKPKIAIDGPAGAGKSTVARAVASRLELAYIDTGAMYRAITLAALRSRVDLHNADLLEQLALQVTLDIRIDPRDGQNIIFMNGEDVSMGIRSSEVSRQVSYVARCPQVRTIMAGKQRRIAAKGGVVMDGRDIGTHVMPDAEFKFYLTASLEERTRRRLAELLSRGEKIKFNQMKAEIVKRDKIDSERECAPLRAADGAIHIDTTEMTAEQVVDTIVERVKGKA